MEQDNLDLHQQNKQLIDKLSQREGELQSITEENEEMREKLNRKIRTQGRGI